MINKLQELEEKVNDHAEILGGNTDREGLVHVVAHIAKTIYDSETGHQTRIDKLEKEKDRAKAYLAGWIACAVAVGGAVVWLIEHFR
jgi:hypothetical protein